MEWILVQISLKVRRTATLTFKTSRGSKLRSEDSQQAKKQKSLTNLWRANSKFKKVQVHIKACKRYVKAMKVSSSKSRLSNQADNIRLYKKLKVFCRKITYDLNLNARTKMLLFNCEHLRVPSNLETSSKWSFQIKSSKNPWLGAKLPKRTT